MSVAHTGIPRTNPDVPSIGSTIHCHGDPSPDAAELLAEQPVVGTGGGEPLGDRRLGGAVDRGDLAAVGLALDVEAAGTERGPA